MQRPDIGVDQQTGFAYGHWHAAVYIASDLRITKVIKPWRIRIAQVERLSPSDMQSMVLLSSPS